MYHQLCLTHAIHLAVTDVFYKKPVRVSPPLSFDDIIEIIDDIEEMDPNYIDINESDDLMEGCDIDEFVPTVNMTELVPNENLNIEFSSNLAFSETSIWHECEVSDEHNLSALVCKVRDVVKIFRSSPTRNDHALTPNVRILRGKELNLLMDCKTRWNSTHTMLERFLYLNEDNCIKRALFEIDSTIVISNEELKLIQTITNCLKPARDAIKRLSHRSTNLLEADTILSCLLNDEYIDLGTEFGRALQNALIKRIGERRTACFQVLQYLQNRNNNDLHLSFKKMNHEECCIFLKELWNKCNKSAINNDSSPEPESRIKKTCSFMDRVEAMIKKNCNAVNQRSPSTITEELEDFKAGREMGDKLTICYNVLKKITCSSVEAERNFSSAGRICNKFRTRLGDDAINNLSMLRSHFLAM